MKRSKRYAASCGPAAASGVVLHREGRIVQQANTFDGSVVGAGVTDHRAAERGVEFLTGFAFEREAVVLSGDRDATGLMLDHRDVDAAVAELHLVGAQAQGAAQDLVAEADTEQRQALSDDLFREVDCAVGGGRVTGTVGEEHSVGLQVEDLFETRVGRQHVDADTALGEHARGVGLDTEVDGGNRVQRLPALRLDDVAAGGADLTGKIGAEHGRLILNPSDQFVIGGDGFTGKNSGLHRTASTQVANQGTSVDPGDSDDALLFELGLQRTGCTPARGDARGVTNDVPGNPDLGAGTLAGRSDRLVVFVVPAGVADLRCGGDDDLAVVAGIGERFLVAGHSGAEHRFAQGLSNRTEGGSAEHPSVFEDQYCGAVVKAAHAFFPFCSMSPELASSLSFVLFEAVLFEAVTGLTQSG